MPNYNGRFTQAMFTKNFGGIDSKATVLNINDNEAADITNFDVGLDGSITRRAGTAIAATIGDNANPQAVFWMPFYDDDGVERFCAIAKDSAGNLDWFDAADVDGTYTNRSATGMTLTAENAHKYIGANWQGAVIVANGTDQPVYAKYGEDVKTLKNASLIDNPTTLITTKVGTGGVNFGNIYGVTAITPRGETQMAVGETIGINWDDLSSSNYNLLSWYPVEGASGYRIYWFQYFVSGLVPNRGFDPLVLSTWYRIADVPASDTTFIDNAPNVPQSYTTAPFNAPFNNTAYRTWKDWEDNGWPHGFSVVSRGRDERAFAWRGQYVWASALNNPKDWLAPNDSFAFSVDGGTDKTITAVASLHEYILVFTRTMCFVYTGASADSITLVKVIPRGCTSMRSIVNFDGDLYFWSDYGPTSFKRIMSGADISSASAFNRRIQNILFNQTNTQEWDRICAHRHIPESRIVWAVPGVDQTKNTLGIVYQADTQSWSKYDNWEFCHCGTDSNYGVYGIREADGSGVAKLWNLMSSNQDNGSSITATYKTGWYDMRSWDTRKRLVFTDVIVDRSQGAYTFTVNWSWDYGIQDGTAVTLTETTTEGATIETTSSSTTEHRVFADGFGNAFQLTFSTTANAPLKVIGWRPEIRGRGVRK